MSSNSDQSCAFEALKAGARAAAAATPKTQSQKTSKKRKTRTIPPAQIPISHSLANQLDKTDNDHVQPKKGCTRVIGTLSPHDNTKALNCNVSLLKTPPASFKPESIACWGVKESTPFMFLCQAFDLMEKEGKTTVKLDIASNMLRTVIHATPDDLLPAIYLSVGKIGPQHEGFELGTGKACIIQVLAKVYGTSVTHIEKESEGKGDLGKVAESIRSSQSVICRPPPLTVTKVFDTLRLITKESGAHSREKKMNRIKSLLVAANCCESKYIIRLLLESGFQIGVQQQTLLAALGRAAVYIANNSTPPKHIKSHLDEASKIVKQVFSVLPVYDKIVPALLSGGIWDLPRICQFSVGVPIKPMLATQTKSMVDIKEKFDGCEFTCEYKYDGERAQVHFIEGNIVDIYSRNLERTTVKYPDVVDAVSRLKKPSVKSFVLDCEIVAYDRDKQKILPFQILSTRGRRNVNAANIKVNVCIYAFDMLYLNGESLLQEQLNVRKQHLYDSFEEEPGYLQFATAIISSDLKEMEDFFNAAINASCEGLVIKKWSKNATYEPTISDSRNWLKLKKDYMEGIGDSLDLVPIAGYHGCGKRTGVYGSFLLACYDSNNMEFQSICKTGTGFSEQQLEELSSRLRLKVVPQPKPYYLYARDKTNPDVWFEPSEVWEIKAASLSISPEYYAAIGIVDPVKGLSLRHPRLVRVREDKNPEQATASEQVAEMYEQ